MTRRVSPFDRWVLITFPDGHQMNATAFVGTPRFDEGDTLGRRQPGSLAEYIDE